MKYPFAFAIEITHWVWWTDEIGFASNKQPCPRNGRVFEEDSSGFLFVVMKASVGYKVTMRVHKSRVRSLRYPRMVRLKLGSQHA